VASSRRCSLDGISYPDEWRYNKCLVCGDDTDRIGDSKPDEDWADKVAALKEHLESGEPLAKPIIPIIETKVRFDGGHYWVSSWDVFAKLYERLAPTDLIQVGQQTFEILAYVHENREYTVRPFSLTLSDEDLAALTHVP